MIKTRRTLLAGLATAFALLVVPLAAAEAPPFAITPPPAAAQGSPNSMVETSLAGDGLIDYRVYYDRKGNLSREELDYNHDGKMDTFFYYQGGVLQRVEIDSRFNGKIDIWVYLLEGKYIQRYERDTTGSGKPDVIKDFGGK
ncbi:MAG: hypothetical protein ABSG63_04695 [Spirochaetia bacterium]